MKRLFSLAEGGFELSEGHCHRKKMASKKRGKCFEIPSKKKRKKGGGPVTGLHRPEPHCQRSSCGGRGTAGGTRIYANSRQIFETGL